MVDTSSSTTAAAATNNTPAAAAAASNTPPSSGQRIFLTKPVSSGGNDRFCRSSSSSSECSSHNNAANRCFGLLSTAGANFLAEDDDEPPRHHMRSDLLFSRTELSDGIFFDPDNNHNHLHNHHHQMTQQQAPFIINSNDCKNGTSNKPSDDINNDECKKFRRQNSHEETNLNNLFQYEFSGGHHHQQHYDISQQQSANHRYVIIPIAGQQQQQDRYIPTDMVVGHLRHPTNQQNPFATTTQPHNSFCCTMTPDSSGSSDPPNPLDFLKPNFHNRKSVKSEPDHPFQIQELSEAEKNKIERKRERNRIAARKCRTRKLERIAELEKRVSELSLENEQLSANAVALKNYVQELHRLVLEHRQSGCMLMSVHAANQSMFNWDFEDDACLNDHHQHQQQQQIMNSINRGAPNGPRLIPELRGNGDNGGGGGAMNMNAQGNCDNLNSIST